MERATTKFCCVSCNDIVASVRVQFGIARMITPQRLSLAANRYAKGLTCGLHTLISHSVAEIVLSLTPRALLVSSGATGFHRRATSDISTLYIRGCGRGVYFQATKASIGVGWGRRNRYGNVLVTRSCTDVRKRKAHDAVESGVAQGT